MICGISFFLLFALFPVGYNMQVYLENMYEQPVHPLPNLKAIVVLGGAIDTKLSADRNDLVLNSAAERLTTTVSLSKLYPDSPIFFTGGNGKLLGGESESMYAQKFFDEFAQQDINIHFEGESRNTHQNAIFLHDKYAQTIGDGGVVVLVTSAKHMRRAVATFEKAGWTNIVPHPTDYITSRSYEWFPQRLELLHALGLTDSAFKEYVGYIIYRLTGKL